MNNYSFKDIKIGMTYSMKKKINLKTINKFIDISGDINPLHNNIKYAKKKGFDNIVVPGFLCSSFFSKFVGVYLPGRKCLLISNKTNFKKPIYPDNNLKFVGTVINKIFKYKLIEIKINIFVNKKLCIDSIITVQVI